MENLTSKYLINGPNNVVRLSNGEKILYIFGDFHLNPEYQRECPINDDYDSIDIDKLLLQFIKKEKELSVDFFIEFPSTHLVDPNYNNIYRRRYIDQINKLFNSKVEIKNNKIITHKNYSNFRFHYFDIRDSIPLFDKICKYFYEIMYVFNTIIELKYIIKQHEELLIDIENLYNHLHNNENYFINKIKNNYYNIKIKTQMNYIFNDIILKNINNSIKNTKNIINLIKKRINTLNNVNITSNLYYKIHTDLYDKIYKNKNLIFHIYVVLTDMYFIRRFLDKEYIKTGIIYTGGLHLCDIVYILTKYFNFQLTNIYYHHKTFRLGKIKKLSIKNLEYLKILANNLLTYDENLEATQCVNLFNFPANFT